MHGLHSDDIGDHHDFAERYKARRYAEGRAEGRSTGLAEGRLEAVELAIRRRTREIDPGVEVTTDDSQWFDREVMRVTLTKSGRKTKGFEITMEQALSPDLRPLLDKQLASLG